MNPGSDQTFYKKEKLLLCLKNITIAFLYLVFFSAHLLSNFFAGADTQNPANPDAACYASPAKTIKEQNARLVQGSKESDQKSLTRLNKRFQPENMILPVNDFRLPQITERYADLAKIGHPTAYLLFSVILARAMRGPPVLA